MKHIKTAIVATSLTALFCGCTSTEKYQLTPQYIPAHQPQIYPQYLQPCISSIPSGAKVFINNAYMGETPISGLRTRKGDTMTIYTPGYEPAHHVIENGEPFNASIPLLPSNRRYFSLLENAKAKFISDGKSVHLESTGAPAGRGSSFVIFDPDAGRDVKLSVIEANPLYVKFKTNDGVEFSYPVTPEEYGKTERIDTPYIRQQPASTHREQGQFRSGLTDEVRQQTPYMY